MKVSPVVRRLAICKEKKKEFSVATLQFDVTFCTPIPCAPSVCYVMLCYVYLFILYLFISIYFDFHVDTERKIVKKKMFGTIPFP